MRWVHSRSLAFFFAVVIPLLAGSSYFIAERNSQEIANVDPIEEVAPTISCFDAQNLISVRTSKNSCPTDMTYLGNAALSESATASGMAEEIHPLLVDRFNVAAAFAKADGVKLYISSGFRSRERQEFLFAQAVRKYGSESEAAKWVLPPQFSHHPQGLAIDVNYPGDKPGALWLEKNGSRFGLCRVYANEWWHFEGVIAPGERCRRLAPNALVDYLAP